MRRLVDKLFTDRRIGAYTDWVIRWKTTLLFLAFLLSALSMWAVTGIRINSNLTALLPKNTPNLLRLDTIKNKVGGFGDLMVMIESPDRAKSLSYARSILPEIKTLPWVENANYAINDSLFQKNKLLFMSLDTLESIDARVVNLLKKEKRKRNPFIVDLAGEENPQPSFDHLERRLTETLVRRTTNISEDGKTLLIVINPRGLTSNIGFARTIYADIARLLSRRKPPPASDITVSIGGTYRNRLDEYDTIVRDIKSSAGLAGTGILLLILIYFRRPLAVVVLLLPLAMSLACTFALTRVIIGQLNLITAFLITILFGLGIDTGIHMLSRYILERNRGEGHRTALMTMLKRSGRASFTAMITTAGTFYILMFSSFLGFRHFGFIAGTGVILAYLTFMTVFPALLSTVENTFLWRLSIYFPKGRWLEKGLTLNGHAGAGKNTIALGKYYTVIAAAVFVTLFSLYMLPEVEFEQDLRNLRSQVSGTREFNRKMRKVFKRARDPSAILVSNTAEAQEVADYVRDSIMGRPLSPVEDVKTLNSFLPAHQDKKLAVISSIKKKVRKYDGSLQGDGENRIGSLAKLLDASPMAVSDFPVEVLRPFMGLPGTPGQLVYVFQRHSLLDLHHARPFAEAVGKLRINDKSFFAVSEPILYVELVRLLENDAAIAAAAALIVLFFLVFMDLNRFLPTLLVTIPLVSGLLWLFGIAAASQVKLNIFNLVVLPSILGIGIDTTIHLFHRFNEHDAGGVRATLMETGAASFFSAATTMVGFGSLLLAHHPGLRSIGMLAVIGMTACFLASVSLLPSLLIVIEPLKIRIHKGAVRNV